MANCLGNEVDAGCVEYNGPAIPHLDISPGDSMDVVISKIAAYHTPIQQTQAQVTTDDIISKSLVRSDGAICGSLIVKRDFAYTLTPQSSGILFNYNLLDIARNLPEGYDIAMSRVLFSGKADGGLSTFYDSKSMSANVTIPLNRYPVTVDLSLRINSPCGQIDMTQSLQLINPAQSGGFYSTMSVRDLTPNSGQVGLTVQLNNLEAKVNELDGLLKNVSNLDLAVQSQMLELGQVKGTVENASTLSVSYVKDGGTKTSEVSDVIGDLYKEIKSLTDQLAAQKAEVNNVKSTIASL